MNNPKTASIERRAGFTCLPNWLAGEATPSEGWLLWTLQSFAPRIHPSLDLLAERSGMARSSVCRLLNDMKRKGWIRSERRFTPERRSTSTVYHLLVWDLAPDSCSCPNAVKTGVRSSDGIPETSMELGVRSSDGSNSKALEAPLEGSDHRTMRVRSSDSNNKEKTIKLNPTALEPPLPPAAQGEHRPEAGAARPCRDRDGFLVSDPEPHDETPAAVQPQPQQRPQPQSPPRPLPEPPDPEAVPPVKPQAQKREAGFVPTVEDVPAELLPVQRELLAFWPARNPKAKRTQQAWKGMLTEARKIQDHQQGGTEILREQLQEGAAARVSGPGWLGLNFNRWQQYGTKAGTPMGGAGRYGKRTTMDRVRGAIALIEQRERAAAARAAEQAGQGALVLAEVA